MLSSWKRTTMALGMSSASCYSRHAGQLRPLQHFSSFNCTQACRRTEAPIAGCRNRQNPTRGGRTVLHYIGRLTTGSLRLPQSRPAPQPWMLRQEIQRRTEVHKYQTSGLPVVQAPGADSGGGSSVHECITHETCAQRVDGSHEEAQSPLSSHERRSITSDSQEEWIACQSAHASQNPVPDVKVLALVPPGQKGTPPGPPSISGVSPSGATSRDGSGVNESGFWQRTRGALSESASAAYSALVDNTLISLLTFLRVGQLLAWLTPELKNTYALCTGTWHHLQKGGRAAYSLVNNTMPHFEAGPGYCASSFPSRREAGGGLLLMDLRDSHFLSLCMKLVYEDPVIIQDIVEEEWGWDFSAYWATGPEDGELFTDPSDRSIFVPRSRACMLTNPHAIVVAFRGSEPTNLINLRSGSRIRMVEVEGLGLVHEGFYSALHFRDPEQGSLADQLIQQLDALSSCPLKSIHLTGHSLGAAMALFFAAELALRRPDLAKRLQSVHAFGSPRVGDPAFCRFLESTFPSSVVRFTHGADIVPHFPPKFLGYQHCRPEAFLTSRGQLVLDQQEVRQAHVREAWFFLPLYLHKLVAGALNPREAALRTLYRLALLVLLPGLSDHFPGDYEDRLRKLLEKSGGAASVPPASI